MASELATRRRIAASQHFRAAATAEIEVLPQPMVSDYFHSR